MVLDGAALADFVVTCRDDEWLYLDGVGWLTARRYEAYLGLRPDGTRAEVPAKYLPFFSPDPELGRALNDEPPSGRTFRDERERRYRALHPDDDESEETFIVVRPAWADAIAIELRARLVRDGEVELGGFGRFTVVEKPRPRRRVVRFEADLVLKSRLATR